MKRHVLRLGFIVMCASCHSGGLPGPPPPAGGDALLTSVTFHITNASSQTLYVDTTGNEGVAGFDIGPTPGCGCTCGHCSTCESCTPPAASVRGVGAGESFDVRISGQVWSWGSGCGAKGCAAPSASARGLTGSVTYSHGYTSSGAAPTTIEDGPSGAFSGVLTSPTSTAQATFDYPQAEIVDIELK